MFKKLSINLVMFALMANGFTACGQKKMSEREVKREQQLAQAQAQYNELQTVAGNYRGTLTNTNPEANLPKRIAMSFITTQEETSDGSYQVILSGTSRFYMGTFDSIEYEESALEDVLFNVHTRAISARSNEHRLTFKGTVSPERVFQGNIYSDALGEVGRVELNRFP